MGLIKKLTGQNLNNMTDEQLQQDIYPVTSIKAIYNEFNERLDCILRRQADYNLSLKKAGTTKYSEIVTYPTLSDALSIFTQGTNTYGDATYFGLQDYGTTISFLDNNLNKWRLFKFKFTGGTLTDAEWNNVSNWEEFSMSSDDIDELRKLITALQNSLAETNQNVSSLSTAVTNLQVKEQELDDKKVDKYSTSHYYDITTSRYSYDLQRVVSVPTNDGTYGAVDFTFMGHSGYTEYNDLLMMSTDESEKVVSLMTDLFYTLVENINGKEYVTLCTVNKANPRNLFQFNIDLNKFGSTYNKGVATTGSDRPDVKNFIWYDNDNTDGRDLKLSDIQTAIAAGDYSKYVALKKGLVIKSSFEDTTLDSKTSCILTISSTDDTAKYKAADLVQYTDFIVKWDNTASKGNLSTFKMQAHTVTETDSSGNQTTSTSYYDASKIYRFSPTSNMNGFTLVGPKDPTNTAGNDSVTLLTYSNSDTKNVIPAGSIVTLTPPATSTDIWLIDVKKPDVYNVDSSIDVEYDEDGRTRVSRDTLIIPFNLPEFISSIPTDLKDKYVAVLKMPYNYSTFRALIGVSIQEGNSPATEPQGGTVHLMFRRGNYLQNSHCFYYGIKSATSTGLTDDAHMDRICFRFADANGDIIDISDTRVVPSTAKYIYLCVCFLSTKGGYVDHFQFSLDQVPYGTSYQGWDYANMLSIGLDDYIKSYATPFTVLDVTYLVPMDGTRVTLNLIESDLNLKIQTLQSSKQDKLTFDVTPTDGSTNPVTSDGISTVLKKKCSIVSEITVAEQTNLSNPVDRGIYIIKKIDSTSTTPEYGSVDSFGGSCLLPHLAIYYKDSDGVFKHAHLPIGEIKSYTSITISSNILTLTKNDGSVETITLPSVQSDWSTTDTSADSYILNKPTALSSFTNDSGYDTVTSVNSKLASYLPLAGGSMTGLLSITNKGLGSYSEGIRIHTAPSSWATIMLCGSDNTGDSGTSNNSWGIFNNEGKFYITRSGSDNVGLSTLSNVNNLWGLNTNTPDHTLTVNGSGSFTNPIDSTYSSPNLIGGVSNAAVNCNGSSGCVGWINGPTKGGRALISTIPSLDNVIYFSYGTSASIAANTNVVTSITFDLAASLISSARAKFNNATDVTLVSYGAEPLTIGTVSNNLGIDGDEIQARANGAASDLFLNRRGGPVHFGVNQYYISSDGSNYTGNAATSYSSNYIKSNTWNWSGVGPQGTGSTVRKIASITDMRYLEIDGGNMVGNAGDIGFKGVVKISITYINGIIISNNSTVSTNLGYVITSTTSGNNGKVNIDLYLKERSGENYYNIFVSKLVGSSISFESPSIAAIAAPAGYVAIS